MRRAARYGALVAALLAALLGAVPASASHDVTPARVGGEDRFDTAAQLAALTYPGGASDALIARADDFPDALAAGGLAGALDAPVLLTESQQLTARTAQALGELGVQRVWLMGDVNAVSAAVEAELRNRGHVVVRVAGPDRLATAAQAARAMADVGRIGSIGGYRSAFVVNALSFPDALSASAPASRRADPIPILLTLRDRLAEEAAQAIDDLNIRQVFVLGDANAVSDAVVLQLQEMGARVVRLGGADRIETSVAVAHFMAGSLPFDRRAVLAQGDDFPDALVAGPHASSIDAPILLTASATQLGEATDGWFHQVCPELQVVRAVGGTESVSIPVLEQAETTAEDCHDGESDQTYIVSPQQAVTVAVGEPFEVSVGVRHDGQPFTGPVDITVFPCYLVSAFSPYSFVDANNDGDADRHGTSNTDGAAIVGLNGVPVDSRHVHDAEPGGDGILRFDVASPQPDCATVVVFHDVNADGQLDVGEDNRPVEPFGLTQVRWA